MLKQIKTFFETKWAQVTELAIACVTLLCAITGATIDMARVAVIVAQVGAIALGIIWLIETVASAFGKKKAE